MKLTSAGVDIGIVVRDGAAALAFYRDLLGMRHEGLQRTPWFEGPMEQFVVEAPD